MIDNKAIDAMDNNVNSIVSSINFQELLASSSKKHVKEIKEYIDPLIKGITQDKEKPFPSEISSTNVILYNLKYNFNFNGQTKTIFSLQEVCDSAKNFILPTDEIIKTLLNNQKLPACNHVEKEIVAVETINEQGETVSTKEIKETELKINRVYPLYNQVKPEDVNATTHNQDDRDYLYEAEAMATMAGRNLSSKRNLIKQLQKHGEIKTDYIPYTENMTDKQRNDAMLITYQWGIQTGKIKDTMPSFTATLFAKELYLDTIIVYVNDEPVGLTFIEHFPSQTIVRIQKGDHNYKGVFQYMLQYSAQISHNKGIPFLNLESDVGDLNLRKMKQSYLPHSYIEKYDFNIV